MIRLFCWLILRTGGWKDQGKLPVPGKYIIVFAPHTSNLDFIIGALYNQSVGIKVHFLIKQEVFKFPFKGILKRLGGIPVNRRNSGDLVDRMVEMFRNEKKCVLAITPEGTRRKVKEWKKGFYNIATRANVPIVLSTFDYGKKIIAITEPYFLTGTVEEEMRKIKLHFKDAKGRFPENFSTGDVT